MAACSSDPKLAEPASLPALEPDAPALTQLWHHALEREEGGFGSAVAPNQMGSEAAALWRSARFDYPLRLRGDAQALELVSGDGRWLRFAASDGALIFGRSLSAPIAAALGRNPANPGRTALVTRDHRLIVSNAGRILWQRALGSPVFTPPLLTGGRVFVLLASRAVMAFDGESGALLWRLPARANALALTQQGVLLSLSGRLIVSQGESLAALDGERGEKLWEVPLAIAQGISDIEKLADLVGLSSRDGASLCLRAFQKNISCMDAQSGKLLWSVNADGGYGLEGDATRIFAAEFNGRLSAYARADGKVLWENSLLANRGLTAPLLVGRSLVVGDAQGFVHVFSASDGTYQTRIATDGSAILAAAALGENFAVASQNGSLFAFALPIMPHENRAP